MKKAKLYSSLINIASPFVYIYISLSTMIVLWIFAYMIIVPISCKTIFKNTYACTEPLNSWDDSQFLIWFFCLIIPVWILTWIFWFFVIKKLNKKTKEIVSWKKKVDKNTLYTNLLLIIIALPVAILIWQIIDNWHRLTIHDFFSFYVPLWIIVSTLFLMVKKIVKK